MKVKLNIYGEIHKITMIPENEADKKILEFVAENHTASVDVKREKSDYGYTARGSEKIEKIELILNPFQEEETK